MTLQTLPIAVSDGYTDTAGNQLRDLEFLGPANTLAPVFRLRPQLETGYQIELMWLQLSSLWLIRELLTRDGTVVTEGIPVTGSGVDLLAGLRAKPTTPLGQLWFTFDDGRTGKPLRDDWRGTAHLYYRPQALAVQLVGTDRQLL